MQDRLGRGGDHSPFQLEGFAAVRISTPARTTPTSIAPRICPENMSVPYTAKVARMNAAVAASLALAPKRPSSCARRRPLQPTPDGAASSSRPISRGQATTRCCNGKPAATTPTSRATASWCARPPPPYWEQEVFVGKATRYTFKDFSVDNVKFGVRAIGTEGGASLVPPYSFRPG